MLNLIDLYDEFILGCQDLMKATGLPALLNKAIPYTCFNQLQYNKSMIKKFYSFCKGSTKAGAILKLSLQASSRLVLTKATCSLPVKTIKIPSNLQHNNLAGLCSKLAKNKTLDRKWIEELFMPALYIFHGYLTL